MTRSNIKIMHSTIFQITTEKVEKGDFLNEDTLFQGDNSDLDYCSDIGEEERKERIENLVNKILPEGMFTLVDEDTIRYNGGVEEWRDTWVRLLQDRCAQITASNIQEWNTLHHLKEAIDNPLDSGSRFYDDCGCCADYSHKSGEFMKSLNDLEAGTLLYVGGVIDYHF